MSQTGRDLAEHIAEGMRRYQDEWMRGHPWHWQARWRLRRAWKALRYGR